MKKNVLSILLCFVMAAGLTAGCGGTGNSDSLDSPEKVTEDSAKAEPEQVSDQEPEHIVISWRAFNVPIKEREEAVEDAINAITVDKIGVEVDLLMFDAASYGQQLPLMLAGNEQVDIYNCPYMTFSSMVSNEYALNLEKNDLLQTYGQGIIEVMSDYLDGCKVNGDIYGLPQQRDYANIAGYMIDAECLDGIGYKYDAENTNEITMEELENLFADLHTAYPDKTVLCTQSVIATRIMNDNIGGDLYGVLMDPENSLEVTDLFETKEYLEYCERMHRWNQAGYISADALSDENSAVSLVAAGQGIAYECGLKAGIVAQESVNCGKQVVAFSIKGTQYLLPSSAPAMLPWCINENTESPEAAMKFMNELYTNSELADLISYGIAGEDYVVNDEGNYAFPEGKTIEDTFHPNVGYLMPNEFITGVWEGDALDVWEKTEEINKGAVVSKAMGFMFDNSEFTTEYSALSNVYAQYGSQIEFGFLDPAEGIPEMVEKLKAAGLETYMQAKQDQLDAWAETVGIE